MTFLSLATAAYAAMPDPPRCTAQIDEARALIMAGRNEEAKTQLTLAIQRCTPPGSLHEKKSLSVAHTKLGALLYEQSTAQALVHYARAWSSIPTTSRARSIPGLH